MFFLHSFSLKQGSGVGLRTTRTSRHDGVAYALRVSSCPDGQNTMIRSATRQDEI